MGNLGTKLIEIKSIIIFNKNGLRLQVKDLILTVRILKLQQYTGYKEYNLNIKTHEAWN